MKSVNLDFMLPSWKRLSSLQQLSNVSSLHSIGSLTPELTRRPTRLQPTSQMARLMKGTLRAVGLNELLDGALS